MMFPMAHPAYAPETASSPLLAQRGPVWAMHLAAGPRPAALSTASRAWRPGAGPSAGKQASGAGVPGAAGSSRRAAKTIVSTMGAAHGR